MRTVPVEGVFDRAAAATLAATLLEDVGDAVVLDFRQVREISDVALALLATTVADLQSPRVILRGLGTHHQRMLRYLEVDAGALGVV